MLFCPAQPGVSAGSNGGLHAYLTEGFITAPLENRSPLVDIARSLNMTDWHGRVLVRAFHTPGGRYAHSSEYLERRWRASLGMKG